MLKLSQEEIYHLQQYLNVAKEGTLLVGEDEDRTGSSKEVTKCSNTSGQYQLSSASYTTPNGIQLTGN